MENKKLIKTGFIFVSVGIIGLVFPFLYGYFTSDFIFLQRLAGAQSGPASYHQYISEGQPLVSMVIPTFVYNPELVGDDRLIIPKAGVNMPIFLSDSSNALWKGGWLFPGTSRPELGGNSVIFGHRFRYLPPSSNTFYNLDKLEIGDQISFIWQGRDYRYEVSDKKIIEPTNLSVIQPSEDARITLITCAPLFSTKQRLVIVGSLVGG